MRSDSCYVGKQKRSAPDYVGRMLHTAVFVESVFTLIQDFVGFVGMDVNLMPFIDGLCVVKKIHKSFEHTAVHFVLSHSPDQIMYMENQCVNMIAMKPVDTRKSCLDHLVVRCVTAHPYQKIKTGIIYRKAAVGNDLRHGVNRQPGKCERSDMVSVSALIWYECVMPGMMSITRRPVSRCIMFLSSSMAEEVSGIELRSVK